MELFEIHLGNCFLWFALAFISFLNTCWENETIHLSHWKPLNLSKRSLCNMDDSVILFFALISIFHLRMSRTTEGLVKNLLVPFRCSCLKLRIPTTGVKPKSIFLVENMFLESFPNGVLFHGLLL